MLTHSSSHAHIVALTVLLTTMKAGDGWRRGELRSEEEEQSEDEEG